MDENDLDLSLGLPCGGVAASEKSKSGSSSDSKVEEVDRDGKVINDFKNFLDGGTSSQKHDCGVGSQRSDSTKHGGNLLSSTSADADASKKLNSGGFWVPNDNRPIEVEEERRTDVGEKRKNLFRESSQQKKHEREAHHVDMHDKTRASHISITTDDGSTAENEDVADSETVGSTSRQILQHDENSKRFVGSSAEVHKELRGVPDSSGVELLGQRRFTISSEKDVKFGNMPYSTPFQGQSINIMNLPYSMPLRDSNPGNTASTTGYAVPGMMQVIATTSGDRPGAQPVIPTNLPLMFGYSSVQLPTLEKDNSRGAASHLQQLHPSYGRGSLGSDKHKDGPNISQATLPIIAHKSSESVQYDGRAMEHVKGNGRQHNAEETSTSRVEENVKGSNISFRSKDPPEQPRAEAVPSEFATIRPGLAADLKFGGSGSYPNLPWVSTTGPGPNGRTISGVTYRYNPTQIRIVCACHGSHMSPEEFVRHASEEQTSQEGGAGVSSFPSSNPAASAQS
ncbi:ninja-family protein mc410 [Solanum pennellii]|uniref:Ninja-family protein n=1 Tax=Solanum pennellii TaxID=28526 RepID=A0ABM1GVK2_SOLPN|nr:ninja-family protein mc410 [Solanum pennellii]